MSDENSKFPLVSVGDIGGNAIQTVNARDLHAFLMVGKDFSTWIKDRIEQYGFTEGVDFISYDAAPQNGGVGNRGFRKEYALSIDMAKELSMVERNEQGKKARQYFIECERRAKDPQTALNHVPTLRQLLLDNVEKVLALETLVQEMQPAVQALEVIAEAHGSLNRTEAAKNLGIPPHTLIRWMKTNGWTYRRAGSKDDIAYQSKIAAGYLEHKISTGPRPDGTEWASTQVRVTPKGLTVLAKAFPPAARAA